MDSEAPRHPRLSALIVGRDAGAFALACVRSLRRDWVAAGFRPGDLETIVVDNASLTDQSHWTHLLHLEDARVLIQESNLGFAGGIEAAFAASRGTDHDYVAILRPDVYFVPGCLKEIVRHLEAHPEVGAVAPRAYVDEDRLLQHVPPRLPGAWDEMERLLARIIPPLARRRSARRTRRARRWWDSELPTAAKALDGSCMFMSREVAGTLAGVMDRRYLEGFGDADLCRRLVERGLELQVHPRAHVLVHGRDFFGEGAPAGLRRRELARRSYLERWSSKLERTLLRGVERLVARWPRERLDAPIHAIEPLQGPQPVDVEMPRPGVWWTELARDPRWETRLVSVLEGDRWRLPVASWDWLTEGRWYLRAIDPISGRVERAWSFDKSEPARGAAVEVPPQMHSELAHDWIGDLSSTVRDSVSDPGWRETGS